VRSKVILVGSMLLFAACPRPPAPDAQATSEVEAAPGAEAPDEVVVEVEAEAPPEAVAPAPITGDGEPVAPAPVPEPSALETREAETRRDAPPREVGPFSMSMDELRELERTPGASPALVQVDVPPAHRAPELEGEPGPMPAAGPSDALVKVFIFSDFQCPVCRRSAEPSKLLVHEFGDDVQLIWVNHALTMHRRAEPAARAAIAAQRQGRFWEFHDLAFHHARALGDDDLLSYARQVGLDLERYARDIQMRSTAQQVIYERSLAEALDVRGTPGFFINGRKTVGWGSYLGVRSQVERALEQARALEAAGTPRERVAIEATRAAGADGAHFADLVWGPAAP